MKPYISEKEETGHLNLWVPEGGRDCASRFLGLGCLRHKIVGWDPKSQGRGARLLGLREEGLGSWTPGSWERRGLRSWTPGSWGMKVLGTQTSESERGTGDCSLVF